jgi:hypothetical protein
MSNNLREYLEKLINQIFALKVNHQQLVQYRDWESKLQDEHINSGRTFWALYFNLVNQYLILEFTKLLDSREAISLAHWLKQALCKVEQLRMTRYDIDTGLRQELTKEEKLDILHRQGERIEAQKSILERLKAHRDQFIAHRDRQPFNDYEKFLREYPINQDDIDVIMTTIIEIMKELHLHVLESALSTDILVIGDIDNVMNDIRAANRIYKNRDLHIKNELWKYWEE